MCIEDLEASNHGSTDEAQWVCNEEGLRDVGCRDLVLLKRKAVESERFYQTVLHKMRVVLVIFRLLMSW